MKIIFDTNVILSALITQGLSSRVLDICIDKAPMLAMNIKSQISQDSIMKYVNCLKQYRDKAKPSIIDKFVGKNEQKKYDSGRNKRFNIR